MNPNGIFKMLIGFLILLQILDTAGFIVKRCGLGFYGITATTLFIFVCVVMLYTLLKRW
jgi:hypothetical protein